MRSLTLALVLTLGCGSGGGAGDDDSGADDGPDGNPGALDGGGGDDGGGGGGGDRPFQARSGTRIKMKVATTPDGAKEFQGWYDTELDIDCQWTVIDDVQRCLPSPVTYANTGYFANASCTTQLHYVYSPGCEPAEPPTRMLGIVYDVYPTCGLAAEYHVNYYSKGSPFNGTVYARDVAGSCVVDSTTVGYYFWSLSELSVSQYQTRSIAIE